MTPPRPYSRHGLNALKARVVDCSHGNSGKDPNRQPAVARDVAAQVAEGSRYICGVYILARTMRAKAST